MSMLSLNLRAVDQFLAVRCPHCGVVPAKMRCVDGDTIPGLIPPLSESRRHPNAYENSLDICFCESCDKKTILFQLLFMNQPESDQVLNLLRNNSDPGPPRIYWAESRDFLTPKWVITEFHTQHGLMHRHQFGFLKPQKNAIKEWVVLFLSLWDDLRDLNRQPISVSLEHAELQSVIRNPHAFALTRPPLDKLLDRPLIFNPFRRTNSKPQARF